MGTIKNAPLAQPDRVFGYEPKGQGFESLTARQKKRMDSFHSLFLLSMRVKRNSTPKASAFVLWFRIPYGAPNKIRFRKKADFCLYYSFFIIHHSLFI